MPCIGNRSTGFVRPCCEVAAPFKGAAALAPMTTETAFEIVLQNVPHASQVADGFDKSFVEAGLFNSGGVGSLIQQGVSVELPYAGLDEPYPNAEFKAALFNLFGLV